MLAVLPTVLGCRGGQADDDEELRPLSIGGDFTLTGSDGKPFEMSSLRGKTVLLFFGYTSCPDICPTTLGALAQAYRELGKDDAGEKTADKVKTVFVSVDPEKDTPEKLREYLDYFAVPAVGLTGTPEQLAAVAKQYGASYERVESDSAAGYLIEHSTYLYLIDPVGRVRHLFRYGDKPEEIARLTAKVACEDCCD